MGDLELMLRPASHDVEGTLDEGERDVLGEAVGQGFDEDLTWGPPAQWFLECGVMRLEREACAVSRCAHGFEALCDAFGIAVHAPRAHLRATRYRVPRHLCLFNV